MYPAPPRALGKKKPSHHGLVGRDFENFGTPERHQETLVNDWNATVRVWWQVFGTIRSQPSVPKDFTPAQNVGIGDETQVQNFQLPLKHQVCVRYKTPAALKSLGEIELEAERKRQRISYGSKGPSHHKKPMAEWDAARKDTQTACIPSWYRGQANNHLRIKASDVIYKGGAGPPNAAHAVRRESQNRQHSVGTGEYATVQLPPSELKTVYGVKRRSGEFYAVKVSSNRVEHFISGLLTLAPLMFAVISLQKCRSFQKPIWRHHEPLIQTDLT